jgi:hypothetical protein
VSRAAAAALIALAGLLGACGSGDGDGYGDLKWVRPPILERPPSLPRDRILVGQVRNDSIRVLRLRARDVRIVDRAGRRIRGDVLFISGFLHGLFPPTRAPRTLPESAQLRLGLLAKIRPGATTPINVSWRVEGGRRADRIQYPGGFLRIPAGPPSVVGR